MIELRRLRAVHALPLIALLAASTAAANGVEHAVDPDKPIPPAPDKVLPFPVVEEASSRAPLPFAELPKEAVALSTADLAAGVKQDGSGGAMRQNESLFLRDARVLKGKVSVPAGGARYVTEVWPGAAVASRDTILLGGTARTVVDLHQSIVTRKDVALGAGESVILGSHVVTFGGAQDVTGTRGGGLTFSSLAGIDWARVGQGAFEVSATQPSWNNKTFRQGFFQGRVDEVTPKSIKLAWLSATRADSLTLADKHEMGGRVKTGSEVPLAGGKKIKVVRVDAPGRKVELDTPEGVKTLSANPDPRLTLEDIEGRKTLIAVGKDFAVAFDPAQSDFTTQEAHLEVYSGIHTYSAGEPLDVDPAWRAYPLATPAGRVVGLYLINDKPIELTPAAPTADGPAASMKLQTTWSSAGDLETFGIDDAKGNKSARIPAKGRSTMNLIAGGGPSADAVLSRVGASAAAEIGSLLPGASVAGTPDAGAPGATVPAPGTPPAVTDAMMTVWRPRLPWIAGGAAVGFLLGFLIGRPGRRRAREYDD
ncbi:MAG: hypothetical protein WKG00_26590 [Polyangiaceae bacterium]